MTDQQQQEQRQRQRQQVTRTQVSSTGAPCVAHGAVSGMREDGFLLWVVHIMQRSSHE